MCMCVFVSECVYAYVLPFSTHKPSVADSSPGLPSPHPFAIHNSQTDGQPGRRQDSRGIPQVANKLRHP